MQSYKYQYANDTWLGRRVGGRPARWPTFVKMNRVNSRSGYRSRWQQNKHCLWLLLLLLLFTMLLFRGYDDDKWQFAQHPHCEAVFGTVPALDHVTCKQGGNITTYLESPTSLCLFTMQLLWGYDDDKWQFTEHPHCEAIFWHCASAESRDL